METIYNGAEERNTRYLDADSINPNSSENLFDAYGMNDPSPVKQETTKPVIARNNVQMSEAMKYETKETNQNLDLLLRNATEIDDRTKDLLMKNRSLVQRLFPSKMDSMVMEMQRNTIKHAMEFRLHLYQMSTQFRLEALREKYNAALMSIRGYYREQVSEFMMNKLAELHRKVDMRQREFLELAKSKMEYARDMQGYPTLQRRYLENIEKEAKGFMTFLQRQIESFENIIDEQIERFE